MMVKLADYFLRDVDAFPGVNASTPHTCGAFYRVWRNDADASLVISVMISQRYGRRFSQTLIILKNLFKSWWYHFYMPQRCLVLAVTRQKMIYKEFLFAFLSSSKMKMPFLLISGCHLQK